MAGPNRAELGISSKPEIRLFDFGSDKAVFFEDIAKRTGGQIGYIGGKPWSVDYAEWRASISLDKTGEYVSLFIYSGDSDGEYNLGPTAIILRDESITFVDPIHYPTKGTSSKDGVLSWVTISRKGINLNRRRSVSVRDSSILEAAKVATQAEEVRLQAFRASQQY